MRVSGAGMTRRREGVSRLGLMEVFMRATGRTTKQTVEDA